MSPRPRHLTGAGRAWLAPPALLAAAALLCACQPAPPAGWSGYVEGDYVQVAAPRAGTLATLAVQAGQPVAAGAALFALEADDERLARDEAQARLDAAAAQARDADTGRRPDELAVARAQLAQARTQAALARSELARQQQLAHQGFISRARLDDVQAAVAEAEARVAEGEAALRAAQLPGREEARSAARATASAAGQVLKQQQLHITQKARHAPLAAQVADTYFRPGEWVPAGQPVVSLLPAGAVKARFYVAEPELAGLAAGQAVTIRCDGCGAPIAARISRIATQAEYTPPVIYSNAQRAKLVFLVEARPTSAADAMRLKPGLPLDVQKAG